MFWVFLEIHHFNMAEGGVCGLEFVSSFSLARIWAFTLFLDWEGACVAPAGFTRGSLMRWFGVFVPLRLVPASIAVSLLFSSRAFSTVEPLPEIISLLFVGQAAQSTASVHGCCGLDSFFSSPPLPFPPWQPKSKPAGLYLRPVGGLVGVILPHSLCCSCLGPWVDLGWRWVGVGLTLGWLYLLAGKQDPLSPC